MLQDVEARLQNLKSRCWFLCLNNWEMWQALLIQDLKLTQQWLLIYLLFERRWENLLKCLQPKFLFLDQSKELKLDFCRKFRTRFSSHTFYQQYKSGLKKYSRQSSLHLSHSHKPQLMWMKSIFRSLEPTQDLQLYFHQHLWFSIHYYTRSLRHPFLQSVNT